MTKRLLVVDDDESNRWSLSALLEDEGFTVDTAPSSAEATRLLTAAERPYDAVLLDQHLGDGLGSHLLPLIRGQMPASKIVLISGSSAGESHDAAMDARLPKGTAFEEVLALIHQLTSAGAGQAEKK